MSEPGEKDEALVEQGHDGGSDATAAKDTSASNSCVPQRAEVGSEAAAADAESSQEASTDASGKDRGSAFRGREESERNEPNAVAGAEQKIDLPTNKFFPFVMGRRDARAEIRNGREMVRQAVLQGWNAQVFCSAERRVQAWEKVLQLLMLNGNAMEPLNLVTDNEELTAAEAIDRLSVGAVRSDTLVMAEGDAESLSEVLGRLAAAETGGARTGGEAATADAPGPTASGETDARWAARAAIAGAPVGGPSPPPPQAGAAAEQPEIWWNEETMTGGGHRASLPMEGSLPYTLHESFYSKWSVYSNLNDKYGPFKMNAYMLPQEVVNALGHELMQPVLQLQGKGLKTVEHALQAFKLLVHGKVRTALSMLAESNVWQVMRDAKDRSWGFDAQKWDAISYEVMLGLVRMKAATHPAWMQRVAEHSAVYYIEASPSNRKFGAGCDASSLGTTDMKNLGDNSAGAVLDTLNDEYRGAATCAPATMPLPGCAPTPWWDQRPAHERRRNIAERAKWFAARAAASPTHQLPAQGTGPPLAAAMAGARRPWPGLPSEWSGEQRAAQVQRRAQPPQLPPLAAPSAHSYSPGAPPFPPFAHGNAYGPGYGPSPPRRHEDLSPCPPSSMPPIFAPHAPPRMAPPPSDFSSGWETARQAVSPGGRSHGSPAATSASAMVGGRAATSRGGETPPPAQPRGDG